MSTTSGTVSSASPVPLKLARQGHPADRLRPGLDDALQTGSMRLWRSPSNSVDDGVDLIAISQRVKRRECETDLGPQGGHDQLVAPGRFDRPTELDILPGVDLRPVDLDVDRKALP